MRLLEERQMIMDKLDEVMIQSQAMSRLGTESKILVAMVSETMK